MLKKKRPQEYKLRAFVGILFLTIAFLIGFAYVLYQQQVLQVCFYGCVLHVQNVPFIFLVSITAVTGCALFVIK